MEYLAGDAFLLLINVFDDQTTPELITTEFVSKLTNSMEYIDDENTSHSLVSILVCLLPVFEERSEDPSNIKLNPILSDFVEKEIFYRENLIYITNRGTLFRLDKCCECLRIMLCKPQLATQYFNINDINLIIDILSREMAENTDIPTRIQIYKLVEQVLENPVYK